MPYGLVLQVWDLQFKESMIFFIVGAIFGISTSIYLLWRKRNRTSFFVLFIFWFCYLNALGKWAHYF